MRGFVLGGTASGVGKTVATLVTIRALETAGYAVQPAKAGPDFIDPTHHEAVANRPSRTLDTWLCGAAGVRRNYHRGEGDVCVVEGVMGLYDGDASTATVAATLDLPVVLVVDANAGMESVGASALGFREYADRIGVECDVVGVLATRAHGGAHEAGIRDSLPEELAYVGRIPPMERLEIPERHLGLELGDESPVSDETLERAARYVDAQALWDLARPATRPSDTGEVADITDSAETTDTTASAGGADTADHITTSNSTATGADETGARIAVAMDEAFRFYYPSTIEAIERRATVVPFSPVAGDSLPSCDGIYLPGGYPELHAGAIADGGTLDAVANLAADGIPVFGECGGMMALCETLRTIDGSEYEMAAVLPATVRMHDRYRALDYVTIEARRNALTARRGATIRGHEFHYSSADPATDARFAFDVIRGHGIDGEHEGLTEYRTLGTYCHVHPESGAFETFLDAVLESSGGDSTGSKGTESGRDVRRDRR